jgi:5-methylcytosine-specific restriction enzyme subunit McrC
MAQLTLREYQPRLGVSLTLTQRDQLRHLTNSISISPTPGETDRYDLTPGPWVGAIRLDGLDIVIQPKVSLDRLLFMLSYSLGRVTDLERALELKEAEDVPEAIVLAFVRHTSRALARGVQQGYVTVDESALTLRGRLRVGDQIRRRYGPLPPAEITYDDFTVDIEMNRILRAAADRLARMRFPSDKARTGLRGIDARLQGVSLVSYDARRLPPITFTRLNSRYRDAVTLGKLILRSVSFDLGHGGTPASAFLVDMNLLFEDFVVEALRDALGPHHGVLVQGARGHPLHLDEAREVNLLPDISLWQDGRCRFVGDVKYKRVAPAEYPNADIYQATAYAVATGLDSALLIYAVGEGEPTSHQIVHIDKRIEVTVLDLAAKPADLLVQINGVAERLRRNVRLAV